MFLLLGKNKRVAVASLQQASTKVRAVIDEECWGMSDVPRKFGNVVDERGDLVARVSYNGRVWNPFGEEIL